MSKPKGDCSKAKIRGQLNEGDRNAKFFHSMTSDLRRCNYVEELEISGQVVKRNGELREKFKGSLDSPGAIH